MDRAISRMFLVGAILMVALMANLAWIQVFHARSLRAAPQNHRVLAQQLRVKRGLILGFDGSTIAGDAKRSGFYYRTYPQGPVAPQVVGYDSVRYGQSGIESSMNAYLSGANVDTQGFVDRLLGRHRPGANVELTIVPAVQKVAQTVLGAQLGAIVALDPRTGAVIAAASAPSYNPATVDVSFRKLAKDPDAPLLSRGTQGLYPPGSSFKVVTATAALNLGKVTPNTPFNDTGTYDIYGGKITNYHGEVFGAHDFTQALTDSINTTFAKVGTLLGQQALIAQMKAYGFYQVPPVELPPGMALPSGRYSLPRLLDPAAPMDPLAVAAAAIGQEKVLATPLQMALVAAGVANAGQVMKPYLVQRVTSAGGRVLQTAAPSLWTTATSPATAQTLNVMMQQVVNAGTGTAAALAGIQVAGKTGTAQRGASNVAWFIAFAPADNPQVAVAVTIENTLFTGGDVAAPLAAQVIKAALAQPSLP
ncbi:MAG: peptidoglycan D,D-transpeptidase FtsI family protein [Thermoleophilia bacterium]